MAKHQQRFISLRANVWLVIRKYAFKNRISNRLFSPFISTSTDHSYYNNICNHITATLKYGCIYIIKFASHPLKHTQQTTTGSRHFSEPTLWLVANPLYVRSHKYVIHYFTFGCIATFRLVSSLQCLQWDTLCVSVLSWRSQKMHEPSWDVCNLNLSRGDSLRSPFFSSRTGVFMHRCALNSDSQGPPSAAAALMVTEQLLRRCREFSALLRGTSAVVFKGGESINHWLSLRWRSANSAPSLSLAGFSNT